MKWPSTRIALALVLLLLALAGAWRYAWRQHHRHDRVILHAARRYGVDPALVKAVVWKESRFDADARGRSGEIGLMQLMDPAAQEWAESARVYPLPPSHLFDPLTNVLAGTWYLAKMLRRYSAADDPVPYALADYNAGRANVLKWARGVAATNSGEFRRQVSFPSTQDYIEAILAQRMRYAADFRALPPDSALVPATPPR